MGKKDRSEDKGEREKRLKQGMNKEEKEGGWEEWEEEEEEKRM